jgi:hypothetical protein
MEDTREQKAFRHSLIIVGLAVLGVFGMFACQSGLHSGNWSIYAPVILLSGLLVFPLVYFSYKRGSPRAFTRRDSTLSAALCGVLAIGYFVSGIVEPRTGWGAGASVDLWSHLDVCRPGPPAARI